MGNSMSARGAHLHGRRPRGDSMSAARARQQGRRRSCEGRRRHSSIGIRREGTRGGLRWISACRPTAASDGRKHASVIIYPNMTQWFEVLGDNVERSAMSFSIRTQLDAGGACEWSSGNGISGLLAQKSNTLSPSFWRMISEILKFKSDALRYLEDRESNPDLDKSETLGRFIQSHGYSQFFQEVYLLFGHTWLLTVTGRSQSFVNKVREDLESRSCQIKTNCHVKSISSFDRGYRVLEADGSEEIYDRIIVAIHAPDALKLLGAEATHEESRILGAFQYASSDVYLHCDGSFMPHNPSTWSACNIMRTRNRCVVTYWMNLLQNIECTRTFLVTLNPSHVPNYVLLKWNTSHFVPTVAASKAFLELEKIQGKRGIWFCGAYQGYGFHEDGLKAGKAAAQSLLGKQIGPLVNQKQMVLSWTETGARLLVSRFLNQYITIGNLILFEEGGTIFSFGEVCDKCNVKSVLQVHDPLFYWKVATEADLGLADAYVNGCFSFIDKREGLLNLFLILIANRDVRRSSSRSSRRRGWWTPLLLTAGVASAKYFLRHISRKNTVTQTRRNVSQHYDLDEEESLEEAQLRKLNLLIHKAKVRQDHRVLEIGSGWGSLAMEVVKQTGCKYTGVTQSLEQLKYAQRRVKEDGLDDQITFLLCDYRQIPACHKYDRIICCEMIEEVGHEYMDEFFGCCESLLAEDGIFVIQSSLIPEERYDEYRRSSDFIKEYIFPGGCLLSLTRITSAMSAASRLCIEHVENIGPHYYTTLIRWMDNFMANKDNILALGFDEKFIRTWEYYFIYCAAGNIDDYV
uniref:Amine oxidase domain-containing protein n=1 Tax=Leersia perrieri TaxID=77586 RepID=A0A0D9XYC6_9ORYZ